MITGSEVAAARARLGWSRRRLAEASGLTDGKIWRIEAKGVISSDEADALEAALSTVEGGIVPDSPVRRHDSSTETPVAVVGRVDQPANLILLEEVSETSPNVYDDLPCGHSTREHDADALCPRHPRNEGVRLISNSELRTFKRCRRKWWLSWYRNLRPTTESPTGALAIGQRVHAALREYYVPAGRKSVDPRGALELLIARDWTAVTQSYAATETEVPLELRRKFAAEAELERAMIEGYLDWLAETGEDADIEVIAPETYLEADVTDDLRIQRPGNQPVKIIGKLDVRARRRRDGVRRFIDHKTVGDFTSVVRTLQLDEQMLHYHLLEWLATEEGEERCDAALYNMLRKVKRTATARPPFYRRVTVHHNLRELAAYKTRLLSTITDVGLAEERLDQGDDPNFWVYPNPTKDCAWDCPFLQVCPMFDDGSRAEEMIDEYFTKGEPLDYYTNAGLQAMTVREDTA
jgi:transcriptional regulator with XRE-family HTH domain